MTDGAGVLLAINRYDEYGQPQSTNLGAFGYTGQAWLPSLSLWHYKSRQYQPALGRFLQTDPIGYAGGTNLYAYVGNNPVNLTDPLGLQSCADPNEPSMECPTSDTVGPPIFVTGERLPSVGDTRPSPMPAPINFTFAYGGGGAGGGGLGAGNEGEANLPCAAANQSRKGVLIQLGYTRATSGGVSLPGVSHTFVMAVDPGTGAIYASRGGMTGPRNFPGQLVASSGNFAPGFLDYGPMIAVQVVGWVNVPFNQVQSYMNAFAASTNANNLVYGAAAQNSNSYSAALLAGMGLKTPTPARNAPGLTGAGSNPPSREMRCRR